jgi:hypothetical protein
LLPCSGGHPEWHFQQDIFSVINCGTFTTENGLLVSVEKWDVMIAFPPCTHLAVSGAAWFEKKRADGRQQQGIDFFLKIANANIKHIAVENPVGIMSNFYRKPDQVIQPYFFGDEAQKTTCLWLKNLPALYHNDFPNLFDTNVTHVYKGDMYEWIDSKSGKKKRQPMWYAEAFLKRGTKNIGFERSKTFSGIARAMAEQWGDYLLTQKV